MRALIALAGALALPILGDPQVVPPPPHAYRAHECGPVYGRGHDPCMIRLGAGWADWIDAQGHASLIFVGRPR